MSFNTGIFGISVYRTSLIYTAKKTTCFEKKNLVSRNILYTEYTATAGAIGDPVLQTFTIFNKGYMGRLYYNNNAIS